MQVFVSLSSAPPARGHAATLTDPLLVWTPLRRSRRSDPPFTTPAARGQEKRDMRQGAWELSDNDTGMRFMHDGWSLFERYLFGGCASAALTRPGRPHFPPRDRTAGR